MPGLATKGGSDSCTIKVPVERREGGSDLRLKAARRHKCIPVNEARCSQTGNTSHGAQRCGQGIFRSAHFVGSVKATCSAFQPELEASEKRTRMHALRVENCPITGQSTSLGRNGHASFLRATFWVLECVSQEDRKHQ